MTETSKGNPAMRAKPAPQMHSKPKPRKPAGPAGDMPGWTNGLRQLYDQVVDEDLPDSFRDLLARLDEGE